LISKPENPVEIITYEVGYIKLYGLNIPLKYVVLSIITKFELEFGVIKEN